MVGTFDALIGVRGNLKWKDSIVTGAVGKQPLSVYSYVLFYKPGKKDKT